MTHIDEELLVAYALEDAEADARAAVESHVANCAACRAGLEELRRVLVAAAALDVPERTDDYGHEVWARLEPRLPRSSRRPVRAAWRPWLAAAAVLVAIVGAFLAGRWSRLGQTPAAVTASRQHAPDSNAIRQRVILAALGDHLERTERTLVEFVNSDADGMVDISAEQGWARDLLDANRLYRQSIRGAASPAIAELLGELEPILLAIVHSPSRLTTEEFEALRSRIEDRSLLFKVRVTGADVRARQRTLIHTGEKTS
jgi:hypothetical protein